MALLWLIPSLVIGLVLALTTRNWTFLLFAAVSVTTSWLMQRSRAGDSVSGSVQISAAGVAIGDRLLPKSYWFWKPKWRELVFQAASEKQAQERAISEVQAALSRGLRVQDQPAPASLVGFSEQGAELLNLAVDGPHLFVMGPTGSGKSRWLEFFLTSMLNSYSNLDFWFADYKGGATLGRFAQHPATVAFTTDLETTSDFWQRLNEFLVQRESDFAASGIARIEQTDQHKRQVVVVDELLTALRSLPVAAAVIETLVTRGRSLGIHLVVSSQGTSGMGRLLLANLRAKLVLSGADPVDLAQLGISEKLPVAINSEWGSALLATPSSVRRVRFPLGFSQVLLLASQTRARGRRRLVR
jgi:hypothetical protein